MLYFISKGFVKKLCLVFLLGLVSSCTGTTDQTSSSGQTSTENQDQDTPSTDETKKPEDQPPSNDATGTPTGNTGSTGGSGGTSSAGTSNAGTGGAGGSTVGSGGIGGIGGIGGSVGGTGGVGGSGANSADGTGGTVGTGGTGVSEAVVPDPCQGIDVDDHNACTTDQCDPATGKPMHTVVVAQDDANVCTIDQCNPVTGQTDHVVIGTGQVNACGGCGALSNAPGTTCIAGSGLCAGTGTYQCNGIDAVACSAQAKVDGTTIADDGNVCTNDLCTAGMESHPAKSNGTACNDGNLCTQTDTCQNGVCTGANPKTCTALDQCHTVGTCAPATGICSNPNNANGASCADANVCNGSETCQTGMCSAGTALPCDDSNACTTDSCDTVTGCKHVNIGTGTVNACGGCTTLSHTPGAACTAGTGACAGSGTYVCNANGTDVTCNASPKADGTTIADDGNVCTNDFCSAGAESHPVKANGTGCSDGNLCTQTDTCQGGTCAAGTALTCNDGDSCTTDSCNAQIGCVFTGSCNTSNLTAVWAGEGGDKVAQEELRGTTDPDSVINSVWDGSKVKVFGAKNEVVNFNLILEAGNQAVNDVSVSFNTLTGPGGSSITTKPASGDGLFNWVDRNIELFYIRYLEIKGLSAFCCNKYDERHIPERLRRPNYDSYGSATGVWADRPDHNRHYPDILAPIELHSTFDIAVGQNQGLWVDVYIPKDSVAGVYTGDLTIKEGGVVSRSIPVELTVRNFTLPDTPSAQTMAYLGYQDINTRYVNKNEPWPYVASELSRSKEVRDRHFQMAHRHKISLIDADYGKEDGSVDAPGSEWVPRLNGSLFTEAQGYAGPGVGVGNNVFSIGTYGSWGWLDALSKQFGYVNEWGDVDLQKLATAHANGTLSADYISQAKAIMASRSADWAGWFEANAPETEFFLYLIDESGSYQMIQDWAQWIEEGGSDLMSMATNWAIDAIEDIPSLDIATSGMYVGETSKWQTAVDQYNTQPDKRVYFYNGGRPASGSFMTEDDGVALRELAWGQFKKKIDRWFYWETTYYNNFQGGTGQSNVFQRAHTFGSLSEVDDSVQGETGWNYSNGDGLLFYPGTDLHYPTESYGLRGPIASLRLKAWRRGIQDVDYLALAAAIDPLAVEAIINSVVPKVLWEYGVDLASDPTYVHTDISWSTDPDVWETARKQLADIIEGQ